MSVFTSILNEIWNMIKSFSLSNLLDILIVAYIIYKAIKFIRETKAGRLFKSLLILIAVYLVSIWLNLFMLRTLMQYVFQIGLISLVIVFQPELSHALEKLGRSKVNIIGKITKVEEEEETKACIEAVVRACKSMQETKTGALIVFEKETMLGDIMSTGTILNAQPSMDLLLNIFYPKSPLHDGAVIIRNARVYAAGCILPLTSNPDISRELGTRHRAAIGVTEESDAVVVVVSEETGTISVTRNGGITRSHTAITLRNLLESELLSSNGDGKQTKIKRTISNIKKRVIPSKKKGKSAVLKQDEDVTGRKESEESGKNGVKGDDRDEKA